jgi:integrase
MPEYTKADIEYIIRPDDFERIYRNAETRREKAWLVVLYLTGCRPQEAIELKKEQITIDGTTITFRIETKKLAERKNRRFMVVKRTLVLNLPKDHHYIRTLESYLNRYSPNDLIFQFSKKTGYNIVSKICKKALGLELCPYNFRHSRMTLMAEAGATDEEIMRFKGARSIRSVHPYIHAREVRYKVDVQI